MIHRVYFMLFFFQAEDGIRVRNVTGVQTCALPIFALILYTCYDRNNKNHNGDTMKKITFMHAADLHLDSPFKGLTQLPSSLVEEVRQSTFHAFDTLINKAIDYQIDFLLLVGDLFDHEEQSLKAQIHLRNAFLKLQTNHMQVYLSYGNHDFIHKNNHQVTFPENVSVFKSEQVQSFFYERDGERLAEINGFSYESRAVTESKIDEYPSRNQNV